LTGDTDTDRREPANETAEPAAEIDLAQRARNLDAIDAARQRLAAERARARAADALDTDDEL
jgi:hypothetical protein